MMYTTKLRKKARQLIDDTNVISVNIIDFETNYKNLSNQITNNSTVGSINYLSYNDFKTTVSIWSNVYYVETETAYILYYETNTSIVFKSEDGTLWNATIDDNGELVRTEL